MHWFDTLKIKYQAGIAHCFVLHGAVDDYVAPGVSLRDYLQHVLASRSLVIFYDISEGITFPLPSMRRNFIRWLGLDTAIQADPIALALQGPSPEQVDPDTLPLPRQPAEALPLLERALTLGQIESETETSQPVQCALVLPFAETLLPNGEMALLSPQDRAAVVTIQRWASDKTIAATGGLVILTTRELSLVHPDVRAASSKIATLHLPLPDVQARRQYIQPLMTLADKPLTLTADLTEEAMATATAGLNLYQIEDVKLGADAAQVAVDLDMIKQRKAEIFRQEYNEVLEILEPQGGFETIGGYDYVKLAFQRIVQRLRRGAVEKLPKGILLLGPAGTGRTQLAMALAAEAGVTCVRFNVGRTLGKYMGQSEAKLDRALSGLISLSPCIAFVDELDQQTGRGQDGDNAVEKRVFARLLEVMGDPQLRGKILWVAASNRPDLIDPAIKRSGRLDYKIPVLPPQPEERLAILSAQCGRHSADSSLDLGQLPAEVCEELVAQTDGWTGAELEKLVLKALDLTDTDGVDQPLSLEHLRTALTVIRPATKSIASMTKLALAEVDDLTLLPSQYRSLYDNRQDTVDREAEELTQARGPRTL